MQSWPLRQGLHLVAYYEDLAHAGAIIEIGDILPALIQDLLPAWNSQRMKSNGQRTSDLAADLLCLIRVLAGASQASLVQK
jgi:hypothetical protein